MTNHKIIQTYFRWRHLIALVISWSSLTGVLFLTHDNIRNELILSLGSDQQKLELKVENLEQRVQFMSVELDRAIREKSVVSFFRAIDDFHQVNQSISDLTIESAFGKRELRDRVTNTANKIVKHFIEPLNENIVTLNVGPEGSKTRNLVNRFVEDYDNFSLTYYGPLALGYIEPLKATIQN